MLSIRSILRVRPSVFLLHSSSFSSAAAVQAERTISEGPRNDWTRQEIKDIYDSPLLDLLFHGVSISSSSSSSHLLFLSYSIKYKPYWPARLFSWPKFTDTLKTSGKCSNVLYFLSRLEGVVRTVRTVLNPHGTALVSKPRSLWTRRL
ncbi:hypothetical protein Tsubulata_021373 [Turnera subulata]|uniref:Uncharacterized protein n=1 Tax=Turnera subulata TaxID=218843 RepID=A0A9Q0FYP7_9ROSI|nr:hypothetical protein Tsubulata_021373 [Turnera subulata]